MRYAPHMEGPDVAPEEAHRMCTFLALPILNKSPGEMTLQACHVWRACVVRQAYAKHLYAVSQQLGSSRTLFPSRPYHISLTAR